MNFVNDNFDYFFSGPTCTIPVRNDLTTLDLTVQQIEHLNRTYDTDVPLVLMNSFLTEEDTARLVRKYSSLRVTIHNSHSHNPAIQGEPLSKL